MQTTTTRAALSRAGLLQAALLLLLLSITTTVGPMPLHVFPYVDLSAKAFVCGDIGSCQVCLNGQSMHPASCS